MSNILKPEISCGTAKEFFDLVLPSNNYFGERIETPTWLFRGQGWDAPLVPYLFRRDPESVEKLQSFVYNKNIDSYEERLKIEAFLLDNFFNLSDKRGLPIPDDSQELRSTLSKYAHQPLEVMNNYGQWLSTGKVLSLVALAQHYGIPTRLLDWSLSPLIAAFFAAEGGVKRLLNKGKQSDKIVFWGFQFPLFRSSISSLNDNYSIKGVTASGAGIPNLKAQQGVFTLVNHNYTNERENDYLSFDKIIENISTSGYSKHVDNCELQKITLPVSESIHLIELLNKIDINTSSVYPGYHSIVSDIKMNNINIKNELE